MLRAWLGEIAKTVAPPTIARKISSVRALCEYLLRTGELRQNPSATFASPKSRRKLPRFLAPEAAAEVMNAPLARESGREVCHLRDALALELLYGSGLRVSELATLDLSQISSSEAEVRVLGKGRKERIVPLGSKSLAALEAYLPRRSELAHPRTGCLRPAGVAARPARQTPIGALVTGSGPALRRPRRGPRRSAPARAAPFVRHAHAGRRRGSARDPGNAGPFQSFDDPALHARVARPAARGIRPGSPPGTGPGAIVEASRWVSPLILLSASLQRTSSFDRTAEGGLRRTPRGDARPVRRRGARLQLRRAVGSSLHAGSRIWACLRRSRCCSGCVPRGAAAIFSWRYGAQSARRHLRLGARSMAADRARHNASFLIVPLAFVAWLTVTANLATRLLGFGRAGSRCWSCARPEWACHVLDRHPAGRQCQRDAIMNLRPVARLEPLLAVLIGLALGALLFAFAVWTGTPSGAGGALAVFGVFKRPELDLRAPGLLVLLSAAAYLAPHPGRRSLAFGALVLACLPLDPDPARRALWPRAARGVARPSSAKRRSERSCSVRYASEAITTTTASPKASAAVIATTATRARIPVRPTCPATASTKIARAVMKRCSPPAPSAAPE